LHKHVALPAGEKLVLEQSMQVAELVCLVAVEYLPAGQAWLKEEGKKGIQGIWEEGTSATRHQMRTRQENIYHAEALVALVASE
jgi:hypothetical protein